MTSSNKRALGNGVKNLTGAKTFLNAFFLTTDLEIFAS
jgi:hypothetical protein